MGTAAIPTCPRCGSVNVRRSMPHTALETAIRSWTPFHLYLCRACEHRGWRLGALPHHDPPERTDSARSLRPVEARDLLHRRRKRHGLVVSILVAILLGTAAGFYVHGCQQRDELERPAPVVVD